MAELLNRKLRWRLDSKGMSERSKSELARRLGIAEADLISRREAAELLGLDEGTLRTGAADHIGFFRQSEAKSARAIYAKPWVEDYKRWRQEGRKTRFPDHHRFGPQPWPDEPQPRPITPREAILMIERWKYKELHRRCEAICGQQSAPEALWQTHRAEAQLLKNRDGTRKSLDDPSLVSALAEKAQEIVVPYGTLIEPASLASLMRVVWEHILETERGWLAKMT